MDKLTLKSIWDSYLVQVIPVLAPDVQVTESKRAFYAGAHAAFLLMIATTKKSDGEATKDIEELNKEIQEFAEEQKNGGIK
jgi:hypothetical protein